MVVRAKARLCNIFIKHNLIIFKFFICCHRAIKCRMPAGSQMEGLQSPVFLIILFISYGITAYCVLNFKFVIKRKFTLCIFVTVLNKCNAVFALFIHFKRIYSCNTVALHCAFFAKSFHFTVWQHTGYRETNGSLTCPIL